MKKKVIISIFLIILILESIIPIQIYAVNETKEVISIPAQIKNYKEQAVEEANEMTGLDLVAGLFIEPTVKFFEFVIDSIMSVFSALMTGEEIQEVMVSKDKMNTIPDLGSAGANFTLDNIEAYKSAKGKLDQLKYPRFIFSAEDIFSGKVELLDINFISNSDIPLRSAVAQWYNILRMVTIIGLLSVLIYTGIKIIISSNANEKSKYKEMLTNWFVAIVLTFSMHYIMAFILSVIQEFTSMLSGLNGVIQVTGAEGISFKTNLIGLARFQMQQQHFSAKIGHLIIYTALVTYTIKFVFIYFKRVCKMAFLTIISPIVALTYPIEKMDGDAQGFKLWLREYIFNALLQPLHYLLYTILVSSSLTLAAKNPLYGIVVLGFMSNAEKILKRIFGFNKASGGTVGGIAGAFSTGAVTSSLIKYVKDPLHPFGGGKDEKKNNTKQEENNIRNNFAEMPEEILNDDTNIENLLESGTLTGPLTNNPINRNPMRNENGYEYEGEIGLDLYNRPLSELAEESYRYWELSQDMTLPEDERQQYAEMSQLYSNAFNNRQDALYANNINTPDIEEQGSPIMRGLKNVAISAGKNIVRPIWDMEKDWKDNGKIIAKNIAKGVVGASAGITAAAVQAGISITDGKYNPLEGVAAMEAGFKGTSNLIDSTDKKIELSKQDKISLEKYKEQWFNRDDVISNYNKEYLSDGKKMRKRAAKNYVTRGVTDFQEQKQAIKYADTLIKERGFDEDEADKIAVATLQYRKDLKRNGNYNILFNEKKRKDFINIQSETYTGAASTNVVKNLHENLIQNVRDFDIANE